MGESLPEDINKMKTSPGHFIPLHPNHQQSTPQMTHPLPTTTARLLSLGLSVAYVAVLYVFGNSSGPIIDRNAPHVIKRRLTVISVFTLVTFLTLPPLVSQLTQKPAWDVVVEMGVVPGLTHAGFTSQQLITDIQNVARALLIIGTLFMGPLLEHCAFADFSPAVIAKDIVAQLSTLRGVRDVLIGPFTEEAIYTTAIITLLHQSNTTQTTLLFLPPVFFSIAHFHHAYELWTRKAAPLRNILLMTLFQVCYTFLFGIFTDFLFIKQWSTWSCFAVHAFCNFMGMPSISVHVPRHPWVGKVYPYTLVLGLMLFTVQLHSL